MKNRKDTLSQESQLFVKKYEQYAPDVIYYKNWTIPVPNHLTIDAIEALYGNINKDFLCFAEIGIGNGATSYHLAKFLNNSGSLHLFDFHESIIPITKMLQEEGFSNIHGHGATFKKMDSYNWNLLNLLEKSDGPLFDYVFLDGAHSFPVDGLAFFMIDMLLKPGGYIDFDDYHWTHSEHIEANTDNYEAEDTEGAGSFMSRSMEQFTPSQLKMKQVALIVDIIVAKTKRYRTIVDKKIYQKIC